jgi:hypothetical protein
MANGDSAAVVLSDTTEVFSGNAPPPGGFMGGDYYVVLLGAVSFTDPTPANVLAEIRTELFDFNAKSRGVMLQNVTALIGRTSEPAFAGVTSNFPDLIRDPRAVSFPPLIAQALIEAVGAHPPVDFDDQLLRWAKYHKHPTVRLVSMRLLVQRGHRDEVEPLLANEPDPQVKAAISQLLL